MCTGHVVSALCCDMESSLSCLKNDKQTIDTVNNTENLPPVIKTEPSDSIMSVIDEMSVGSASEVSNHDSEGNWSQVALSHRRNRKRPATGSHSSLHQVKAFNRSPLSELKVISATAPAAKYRSIPTTPLVTQNRFDALLSVEGEGKSTEKPTQVPPADGAPQADGSNVTPMTKKKEHVPPITVTQAFGVEDAENMRKAGSFEIRRLAVGAKLHAASSDDFVALKSYCVENKIEFFTHPPRNTGKLCVVLKGLDG